MLDYVVTTESCLYFDRGKLAVVEGWELFLHDMKAYYIAEMTAKITLPFCRSKGVVSNCI